MQRRGSSPGRGPSGSGKQQATRRGAVPRSGPGAPKKPRAGGAPKPAQTNPSWKAELTFPTPAEAAPVPEGFEAKAREAGIQFEEGEVSRLAMYLATLMQANEVINLTAVKSAEEAWERHLLDSLMLLPVLAEAEPGEDVAYRKVLDVGSGGGLPGIPLAICMPEDRVTLLDSTEKKCRFLRHARDVVGLENLEVVHDRAEHAGQLRGKRVDQGGKTFHIGAMRGQFDVVTARAVGRLSTLAELTIPFARVGGLIALIKGEKADEELAEAKGALHALHTSHAGTIDTPTGRIIVLEKRRETPRTYPRPNGEPKRKPLGVAESAGGS